MRVDENIENYSSDVIDEQNSLPKPDELNLDNESSNDRDADDGKVGDKRKSASVPRNKKAPPQKKRAVTSVGKEKRIKKYQDLKYQKHHKVLKVFLV